MDEVFKTLFEETSDVASFADSLERNFLTIQDFFNASYQTQYQQKDDIERLILLKNSIISHYDFQTVESRSFVLILLDLCERFALHGCIPRIMTIIQRNNIVVNKRMTAALKFLFPRPSSNEELVGRFDEICELLNEAVVEEEDNPSKALVTFLDYYGHIVYDTNVVYATKANQKLCDLNNNGEYNWLKQIEDISLLDVSNPQSVYQQIEKRIDALTTKVTNGVAESKENLLIEEGTEYCDALSRVPNDFISIRKISVDRSNGIFNGRGVNQLQSEEEMFEYIKRYGKMHYAKLISSFESAFPQNFDTQVNIVDWGCGQGLATITLLEKYKSLDVGCITLIEPSEIVLKRAALHCRKFTTSAKLNTVCKKLDDVVPSDIKVQRDVPTIHLFSNILDIDDYNSQHLLSIVDSIITCCNYFVCVSPYIDDIKTARLNSFMMHFRNKPTFVLYHDVENTKYGEFWQCNNSFKKGHFSHGTALSCRDYDSTGCSNKWTRVLKVFSV